MPTAYIKKNKKKISVSNFPWFLFVRVVGKMQNFTGCKNQSRGITQRLKFTSRELKVRDYEERPDLGRRGSFEGK